MTRDFIKIHILNDLNARVYLMGFRGIGQVGYLAIRYLVNKLDVKRVGLIESLYTHPVVNVGFKEDLLYPLEIYEYKNLGIIRIEDIPLNNKGAYMVREIIKWLSELDNSRLILIGGLVSSLRESEEDIARIVYNSYWDKQYLEEIPLKYAQDNVRILGPLAYALYFSEIYKLPALAILAYANPETIVDPRGVYYALEALKRVIKIDIDTAEILRTAEELEKQMIKMAEEFDKRSWRNLYT